MRRWPLAAWLVLLGSAAPSATLEVRGTPDAVVELRLADAPARSERVSAVGRARFHFVPAGICQLSALGRSFDLVVAARESVTLSFSEQAGFALIDRRGPAYGASFGAAPLRELPSGGGLWPLLETVEGSAVTDRIDAGGLYAGTPALLGAHGGSWTDTVYRLGELDATDPDRGGTPLFWPDTAALEGVQMDTALTPADSAGPGPVVVLEPRRPGSAWHGAAEATGAPASSRPAGPPPIARFASAADASLTADGPLLKDRLGLLVAGRFSQSRRLDRDQPDAVRSRVGSLLAHLVATPGARDEVRLLALVQHTDRPDSAGFVQIQSVWERRAGPGLAWSLAGGYQHGAFQSEASGAPLERLLDGPVPEQLLPGRATRARWDLAGRVERDLGRHALRLGASAERASAMATPSGIRVRPVLLDGAATHVWDYDYAGPESRRHSNDVALWASDRIAVADRLELEAGLRYERTTGSADRGGRIAWQGIDPRLQARWRLSPSFVLFGGAGRYRHALPLRHLAFGDPAGPQGAVYLWQDANQDRVFQESERGALVSRVGPGSATIEPGLKPPHTREAVVGFEARVGPVRARLAGHYRKGRNLVESVNVGVPFASYQTSFLADPAGDILGPADDQLLPIRNRDPASFGQDRYLLTNPRDHSTLYEGVELEIDTHLGRRVWIRLSGAAFRADGYGSYRGFRASENDSGLVGETFDDPNADTHGRGRLFFDRAYTLKLAGTWRAPGDVRLGAAVRYQDGQPFSRLVIATGLNQGTEAIRAIPDGRSRFGYNLTLDVHLEKGFTLGRVRLAGVAGGWNLTSARREIEEYVVTGPRFRETTAVQPPRSFRFGARVEF